MQVSHQGAPNQEPISSFGYVKNGRIRLTADVYYHAAIGGEGLYASI